MRIKLHTTASEQLVRLGRSLSPDPRTRARLVRQVWEEFKRTLREGNGPPPGSVACSDYGPDCWWVAFPPCYLAVVRFRTTRVLFGWVVRRSALVIDLNFSPGLPEPVA
jgi:hypothetical protein